MDASDVLAITSIAQDAGRAITFSDAGGVLSFDAAQLNDLAVGESEALLFTYTVDDQEGQANSTNTAQLTVTVEGRNDRPVIVELISDHDEPCESSDNGAVTIDGAFSDIDLSDIHTVNLSGATVQQPTR